MFPLGTGRLKLLLFLSFKRTLAEGTRGKTLL